ncbi:hypothetical protein RUE5091_00127 [Ruegeria denitrificans]|uniref:Uncharacterized protein n=1 Tax=Ruegeria denitrificans TaxID=1715692 RepID=A0A0P1ILA5_9RHOB|nr:DUF6339 family protein [Ruegeria denitrificans]CUJ83573.1 hypothetical protein RUE5091_00127 [Ruegeria denitrificans]
MSVFLFPRLSPLAVEKILAEAGENSHPTPTTDTTHPIHPLATFGASGGSRVSRTILIQIRERLLDIAKAKGYPDPDAGRTARSGFDLEVSAALATTDALNSGEALRDEVWAYIATVLLPDVTYWRFGNAKDRFRGGIRNAFQRLWLRGRCLDRGAAAEDRWGLIRDLTEDALVQIFERPGLSADPDLAQAVAEAWVRAAKKYRSGLMEEIMRNTAVPILAMKEIRSLTSLNKNDRITLLDEIFQGAADSLVTTEEPVVLKKTESAPKNLAEHTQPLIKSRKQGLRSLFARALSQTD